MEYESMEVHLFKLRQLFAPSLFNSMFALFFAVLFTNCDFIFLVGEKRAASNFIPF